MTKHTPSRNPGQRLRGALAGAVLLLGAVFAAETRAAAPPEGHKIELTATATFTNAAAKEQSVTSNKVVANVQKVRSVTLSPASAQAGAADVKLKFAHTATNTGNGKDTFDLTAIDVVSGDGGDFGADNIKVFQDTNNNGVYDSGEEKTSTGELASGSTFEFLVQVIVPDLSAAATVSMTVTATGINSGPTASQEDTVTVNKVEPTIDLKQALDAGCDGTIDSSYAATEIPAVNPGECISYQVSVTNSGNVNSSDTTISLDTPSHTIFHRCSGNACAPQLTDAAGTTISSGPSGDESLTLPDDDGTGTISTKAVTLAPSAGRVLTFTLKVNE